MKDFEHVWYETSPYVYLIFSVIFLFSVETKLGKASCALLIMVSLLVIYLRRKHRSALKSAAQRQRHHHKSTVVHHRPRTALKHPSKP